MASFSIMFQEKMSDAIGRADKEDLRTAVAMLRALRGWSQADLALAAGLGASAVSRYESGAQEPSRRTFDRIVAAVGVRPPLVRNLLTWIRRARAEILGGGPLDDLDDFIESSALDLAESFSAMMRSAVADLEASRTPEEAMQHAPALWDAGEPGEPSPLSEERPLELESSLPGPQGDGRLNARLRKTAI